MIQALLVMFTMTAFTREIEVYRFGNTVVAMTTTEGMLVNDSCSLKGCMALKQGKEKGKSQLKDEWLEGGINPFAARCKHIMGGTVRIGLDQKGNENAFCHFEKDDSYLR